MPYPYFVDIRTDGMDTKNPILGSVAAVTLNWASPLTLDEQKNTGREVSRLLSSSANSWTTTNTVVQPDLQFYPALGFPEAEVKSAELLAVAVKGDSAIQGFLGTQFEIADRGTLNVSLAWPLGTDFTPDQVALGVWWSTEFRVRPRRLR